MSDGYKIGYWITFVLIFLGSHAYCTITYGFLFGFGLGWLPSAILAGILSFLWPLILAAVGIFILWFFGGRHP